MTETEQISRSGLAWILLSQVAILLPHLGHAPVWIWSVWLVVVIWRAQIFRGAWNFPGRWVKAFIIGMCCVGLAFTLRGKFDMQGMVSLLLIGFILKLLEMKKRRDFLALCYLGYFVIITQFLFFSNLFAAFYGVVCITLLTTALSVVNQSLSQQKIGRGFRLTLGILLRAAPLMLLLFIIIPRLGPLWAVPGSSAAARTGMSDSMSPGDFNTLMKSNDLAFRVTFFSNPPPLPQLYWRGLVFSHFDGRTWSQSYAQFSSSDLRWNPSAAEEWLKQLSFNGPDSRYEIIMEPSRQPWLFSLAAPRVWGGDIGIGSDLRLQKKSAVNQRFQYQVTSVLDYQYESDALKDSQYRQELSLPATANPRTKEAALAWMAESKTPERYIQKVLAFYRDNFVYTLQPDLLGDNSVDQFLWQTRAGFCEHFSSSFVVLMRAAGIPARVVVGYQGGEFNRLEKYWLVRQRDAHAWAEVWIQGKGWIRIDPTAAVAPERIERGIDFSLNEQDSELLGNTLSRRSAFFNQLTLRWDAINYQWSRWVLNYNSAQQQRFFSDWLGGVDLWRILLFAMGAGGAIFLAWIYSWSRTKRIHRYPGDEYYLRFVRKLERVAMVRQKGETPNAFAERVIATHPEWASPVTHITQLYVLGNYGDNRAAIADLANAVRGFKPTSSVRVPQY
jgi:transglutaminase-like putative cysteine protease